MNDCPNCKALEQKLSGREQAVANMHEDLERKQQRIDKLVNQINIDWDQIYKLGAKPKVLR